ncbi:peptide chain release factor-like protein [Fibrobacter sp.]|uniref:peptide chain release factor-like protein n=1 Tax=Fibrobacter sp. TaxID=35828 RepID=UPI0038909997
MTLDELLAACTQKGFQGSGPGGQHRNKTNTGVQLLLREYNLEIKSCEARSAKENRVHALHRMQMALALQVRETPPPVEIPFPGSNGHIQTGNSLFPLFVAHVFDIMATKAGDTKAAAQAFGLSPSALVKILRQDKACAEKLQSQRQAGGKSRLKL